MRVEILPSAKQDLRDGYRFYDEQEQGLGDYFFDSLASDIDSLQLFAGTHRQRADLFRFKSKRFPYWVYYRLAGDTAYITAVLDARQDPTTVLERESKC